MNRLLRVALVVFGLSRLQTGAAQIPMASSPATQAPSPVQAATSTVLRVSSNLVLVDIVVTDHGEPVHGLKQSDFKILEDGQERPIVSFDEHQPAGAALDVKSIEAQAAALQAALPPHGYTNIPLYPQDSAVNVLLLDELNTPPASLPELRKQMAQYLDEVPPGTSMAIFVLTSQLRMVTGFTANIAQFAPLFDDKRTAAHSTNPTGLEANDPSAARTNQGIITRKQTDEADRGAIQGGPAGQGEEQDMLAAGMNPIAVANLDQSLSQQQNVRTDDSVGITLAAFRQLARYLSAIPGRKNLIWLSGSFPIWLGPGKSNYEPAVRSTMSLLAAARVAVYPVDVKGVRPGVHFDATMSVTAELTGGKAYVDTNGFKDAMANAVQNGSSYYTISYQPGSKPFNGEFRKIKVDIDQGHYTLDYRNGYYADPTGKSSLHSPAQTNLITEAAMHGAPPMTQVLFVAQVLPSTDPAFKNIKFPSGPAGDMGKTMKQPAKLYIVNLTLDPHNVVFNQMSDGTRQAQLRFALVAYDANGQRLNFLDRSFAINVKPEDMEHEMNTGIHARFGFDLPAGHEFLRVAIEDLNADSAGSLEIPLSVAEK